MPTILGANSVSGYDISNSLRFGTNTRLTREFDQDPTGARKTFTISCWVKRSSLSANQCVISASTTSNFNDKVIGFRSTDAIEVNNVASGNDALQIITNRLFRDTSAWYHIVVAIDTTESAIANGVKFYVNGVRDTDYDGTPVYNQNATFELGRSGSTTAIGMLQVNSSQFFNGYMTEFHFIDGAQKAETDFGEFDDNGVWIPKKYSGTYGDNGFFLEFLNSGNPGVDTSGNSQTFASSNFTAQDNTTDTCTNNFATLRPHGFPQDSRSVLSEGNTDFDFTGDGNLGGRVLSAHAISNIGVTTGKWYAEFKLTEDADGGFVGVSNLSNKIQTANIDSYNYLYTDNGNKYVREKTGADESNAAHGAAVSVNDIVQVALDATNRNVYFGKGGSWASGSGAWDQSGPTSAVAYTADFVTTDSHDVVVFNVASAGSSEAPRWQANFGNPPFAISSGNADGAGHGNFEFAVPSGYFALNTKNLAEYG